jgi:hypothetical protein
MQQPCHASDGDLRNNPERATGRRTSPSVPGSLTDTQGPAVDCPPRTTLWTLADMSLALNAKLHL